MNQTSDWVVLGRFGRPQGLKGLVRVTSFTDPEDAILDYVPWHMQHKNAWVPVNLLTKMVQNNTILVQIEGFSQREEVAKLTHVDIGILRSQMPKLPGGQYYWHELKTMQVRNQQGCLLGHVLDILPTGANDVLVVNGSKRRLIPYIPGVYVLSVDTEQRLITVDWDEHF